MAISNALRRRVLIRITTWCFFCFAKHSFLMLRRFSRPALPAAMRALPGSSAAVAAQRFCAGATPGKVTVTFIQVDGTRKVVAAKAGDNLMETARDNDIDIEAACDGTCACSTCHCFLSQAAFDSLEPPSEDELDMLDLAVDPRPTSRLACQITLGPLLDGAVVELPKEQHSQLI
jgi:ferredoxin